MSEGYYMCFVKGVPNSTQIKWFVEKYSISFWKQADLRHVEIHKSKIDGHNDYVGVYIKDVDEYRYILMTDTLDDFKNFIEVFYPVNDICIGEL